jgi:hypothetical protein
MALVLIVMPCVFSEELVLTTYFPSPRGTFNELKVREISGLNSPRPYTLNMETGVLEIQDLVLLDEATGERFRISINERRVIVADLQAKQGFILFELPTEEEMKDYKVERQRSR